MRIPIALQLALLVLVTTLGGIAILAVATWITTYKFVVDVGLQGLQLVASIKGSQVASNLDLIETTGKTIATRLLIQSSLQRYYAGNASDDNWTRAVSDLQSALGSRGYLALYQAVLYSRGGKGDHQRLLSVTSDSIPNITLPYNNPDGSRATLGHGSLGYPPMLYPNLTYTESSSNGSSTTIRTFPEYQLGLESALFLGPLELNSSNSLISLTVPIVNNTSATDLLGFLTIVASANNLQSVLSSRDGLGETGQALLLGPLRPDNKFAPNEKQSAGSATLGNAAVHYVFEPTPLPGQANQHPNMSTDTPFALSQYPAAFEVMRKSRSESSPPLSYLSTVNEQKSRVAVGMTRPTNSLVEWILVVEQTHPEAFRPIVQLRQIILACVLGTTGAIICLVPILAHWAVAPIRRLREAAQRSVVSQEPSPSHDALGGDIHTMSERIGEKNISTLMRRLREPRGNPSTTRGSTRAGYSASFQTPGRVKESNRCVRDELTELTATFNEMSDELTIQYNRLEERVVERTRELEKAKLAAETANESKTLFIANISHELKTPLNGILGMCAVCMGDNDLPRVKKSLQVVYQSGDLLLHLLNDLLTFSKNQIEQAIQLDEKEFRMADICSQLAIIFQNQVQEKNIQFRVHCVDLGHWEFSKDTGTLCLEKGRECLDSAKGTGTGRIMDMVLWGDQHRILQVLINLVSNGLKFTPDNGRVEVRILCTGEERAIIPQPENRRASIARSHRSSAVRSYTDGPVPPLSAFRSLVFHFEVEDNGPGIPAHLHRRVFEPFVQGDLGLNRKYGGTGLGLSICAQLARIMGGDVHVRSEEGRGSTFTLKIPLRVIKESTPSTHSSSTAGSRTPSMLSLEGFSQAIQTTSNQGSSRSETMTPGFKTADVQPRLVGLSQPFFTSPVPSSAASSNPAALPTKRRVLVAEDNSVNQEVVRRMLALEDVYDVTMVKDGQEAYDAVKLNMEQGQVFDLIFMDIQMPNLDGLQSTRMIRELGYSAPIVALSAFAEDSNIKDCLDCGMNMFMSKPIRRPALKQVLHKFTSIPEE